jgi:hypothetical protein
MSMRILKFSSIPALALGLLYLAWLGQVRGEPQSTASQRTFASPTEAASALVTAARAHDRQAIHQIFGPEVTNLMTGDQVLDQRHFDAFTTNLTERCDLLPQGSDRVTLEIGRDPWPFPIPLIKTNGVWIFDTIAGEEEIINRHIGRDEYYAIGVCRTYVNAQREYANRFASTTGKPIYAEKFRSSPGKMDGLYWPVEAGGKPSPLSPFVAEASMEGYKWNGGAGPRPFHGYCFKILTRQGPAAPGGKRDYVSHGELTGGFALVAFPIRWGESGIMTFIVNQDGIVYQQNLGDQTRKTASAMKDYNPDNRWTVVKDPGITGFTAIQPAGQVPQVLTK